MLTLCTKRAQREADGRAFKKRHNILVKNEMDAKQNIASGLSMFQQENDNFSQVQAAWRFYNNESVTTEALQEPIVSNAVAAINEEAGSYVIAATDWSHVDYKHHHAKQDRISKKSKANSEAQGYDLQSTLAVSTNNGAPIAPLVQNLKTATTVHSTYHPNIAMGTTHLSELAQRAIWMKEHLDINKTLVHVIDREADSVALYREFDANGLAFIVRAKTNGKVEIADTEVVIKQGELADSLAWGEKVKSIVYKQQHVNIYVNEIAIVITRDATQMIKGQDGRSKLEKTAGAAVPARFIVERLVNEKGEIVATWLLISNLPPAVNTETIGLWYYYRWNIESYFKLLKSSGFTLEQWQQEESGAIFRRLLVVSLACILVWKLANATNKNAQELRKFLVKISGRLVEKKKEFTAPALLAGLWSFLTIIETMQHYDLESLLAMKSQMEEIMGIEL